MPLYEYFCNGCQKKFEQITSSTDPERGKCPKCNENNTKKLISRFAVGGQGDLRESTLHGCHGCHHGLGDGSSSESSHSDDSHSHSQSHDHGHDHS